jgi:hypothetical protein
MEQKSPPGMQKRGSTTAALKNPVVRRWSEIHPGPEALGELRDLIERQVRHVRACLRE